MAAPRNLEQQPRIDEIHTLVGAGGTGDGGAGEGEHRTCGGAFFSCLWLQARAMFFRSAAVR